MYMCIVYMAQCSFYMILAGPAFVEQSGCKEKLKKVPDLAFEIIKAFTVEVSSLKMKK